MSGRVYASDHRTSSGQRGKHSTNCGQGIHLTCFGQYFFILYIRFESNFKLELNRVKEDTVFFISMKFKILSKMSNFSKKSQFLTKYLLSLVPQKLYLFEFYSIFSYELMIKILVSFISETITFL